MSNNKSNSRGFTLIELLIVVAITGVLASVVFASLGSTRSKSRNTQRSSDIKQLVNAFNLGLTETNLFPSTGGGWACVSLTCYGGNSGYSANGGVDAFLTPFIKKPDDPSGGGRGIGGYIYNSSVNLGGAFPVGAYILWYIEPPLTSMSCTFGTLRTNGGNYLECAYKLN